MKLLSNLCYLFAAADAALANFFEVDITGVWWSPIAACFVGWVLAKFAGEEEEVVEE